MVTILGGVVVFLKLNWSCEGYESCAVDIHGSERGWMEDITTGIVAAVGDIEWY